MLVGFPWFGRLTKPNMDMYLSIMAPAAELRDYAVAEAGFNRVSVNRHA